MTRTVLVARLDGDGDVLVAGPAVRAVAARADRVVLLCGPRGRAAAELLPGVDRVLCWAAPWIEPRPQPVGRPDVERLVAMVGLEQVDRAVLLSSFHQSSLPLALLLRLAEIRHVSAISEDYPGSLLDVRVPETGDIPETERALRVAAAAGFDLPAGDTGRLAVRRPLAATAGLTGSEPYVVCHPGTSVSARAWPAHRWAETVALLGRRGRRVAVTGSASERALTALVAADSALDLGGRTSLAELAGVLGRADAVVVANTGPAHLAAAVGTPVVSLFAPTVPATRWAPYGVALALLGDQAAACAGSRATTCPLPGHPCLASVTADDVARAVATVQVVAA